jgi:cysteine synthase A
MVFNNVLEAVGNTPLIRLNRLPGPNDAEILVKFEAVNIGGSTKTRTALNMILAAEKRGDINPDTVIVEPTSGNQGIGLALVSAVRGYKAIMVMPDSVSEERRKILKLYGAELILVEDKGNIGECIANCLATVQKLAAENPRVYVPQQFVNPDNPQVHRDQTAREIIAQAGKTIHGFCSGIGTGGSLTGIGEILRKANPDTLIWALEPDQAAILAGGPIGSHLQMGIGDGLIPDNLNTAIYNEVITVTDAEALQVSRELARKEGLLCGISSGTNVAGALRMAKKLGKGKSIVTLLPDTGERYFSTPLFD